MKTSGYLIRAALFMLTVSLLTGCNVNRFVEPVRSGLNVPTDFREVKADTVSSGTLSWRQYFTDSSLISLIDTALVNNSEMKIAWQRIEESRSDVLLNRGQLFPSVNVGLSGGQSHLSNYSAAWASNQGVKYTTGEAMTHNIPDFNLGFLSSWEIDMWGKFRYKKKAAFDRLMSSVDGKNLVMTNLIADVAYAYYDLLAFDNDLKLIRETILLQKNALDVVRSQKEAATANELAVKQFEAQVLNSESLAKSVSQDIAETENRINLLLGRFNQPISRDLSSFADSVAFRAHSGIPSQLLANRPDIRQAELELMAAKADLRAAKAAFYPSLTITGSLGFNSFNPAYLLISPQSVANNILAGLAAPLINRSAVKAEFNKADAYQLESLYNYQKAILTAYSEVRNELSNLGNLEQVNDLKSREVNILSESITTSVDLFKTGRATYLEVLLTQQNALQAKLELIDTMRKQHHSMITLYKALGGGWR